jgi:predicted RNase H-like HicB family nuclease
MIVRCRLITRGNGDREINIVMRLGLLDPREFLTYTVEWSDEDQVFVARTTEPPLVAAHGPTWEEALLQAYEAKQLALEVDEQPHGRT